MTRSKYPKSGQMSSNNPESGQEKIDPLLSHFVKATVNLIEVGERIKEVRLSLRNSEGKKLSRREFGLRLGGVSPTALSRYEEGERLPDDGLLLFRIADLDHRKRGIRWLLGGMLALERALVAEEEIAWPALPKGQHPPKRIDLQEYPMESVAMVDAAIAAGPGSDVVVTNGDEDAIEWVPILKRYLRYGGRHYRLLRLKGDSMDPMFKSGTLVLVNTLNHDPKDIIEKPVAVWRKYEKGATVKILREGSTKQWLLHPINQAPMYKDEPVDKDEDGLQIAAVEGAWQQFTDERGQRKKAA